MKKKSLNKYIVLQCQKCKEYNWSWEVTDFPKSLKKKYLKQGWISQACCETNGLSNTPHKIYGIIEEKYVMMPTKEVLKLVK